MSYDLVIKNGMVVDGTGAKRYQADVAIQSGKVAEIGKVTEGAKRTIDADGLVVTPGFVDPHTHYDAQICWDGAVTPSSWHGVTSVVMGNCGVGIAPCRPETREIAMKDLVNVEGIPFDVLNKGITWDWETFPEFMDAAAARKPSLNLAFIAPLTPFRHYVMGEASMDRAATPEETAKIAALIGEAVDKGALGFSSTTLNQHMGFEGKPLACRNASREELAAYCQQLKKRGKGAIEIALTRQVGVLEQDQCELLDFLLDQSGRPVTFIALFDRDDIPEAVRNTLRLAAPMIAKGARPQTSPLPLTRECTMENPFAFAAFPSWKRVFADTNPESQKKVYADPAFRNAFRHDLKNPTGFSDWRRIVVHDVKNPALKDLERKSIAEVASLQNKDGVDAFLDLVLADDLKVEFTISSWNTPRGSHARTAEQQVDPDGAGRRRRACRHAVRRGLPDLPARHLGAREGGDHLGRGRAQADLRSRRSLRSQGSRSPREGRAGRRGDLRPDSHRLEEPRRAAFRPARRCQAHRHAVGRRRVHDRQRRADLGAGPADRGQGRRGVAGLANYLSLRGAAQRSASTGGDTCCARCHPSRLATPAPQDEVSLIERRRERAANCFSMSWNATGGVDRHAHAWPCRASVRATSRPLGCSMALEVPAGTACNDLDFVPKRTRAPSTASMSTHALPSVISVCARK